MQHWSHDGYAGELEKVTHGTGWRGIARTDQDEEDVARFRRAPQLPPNVQVAFEKSGRGVFVAGDKGICRGEPASEDSL